MKKISMQLAIPALLIMAFSLITSCTNDSATNDGTAHVNMYLTDAPAAYDAVNINIQAVEINTNEEGWHTYTLVHPGIYDLLHFSSGLDTIMISEDISPATISQIRLILGDGSNVVVDGVTYPLETPSAEESGLKLNVHYTLEAGLIYNFWLDFDAEQSIVEKGNGDYSLKPVIRVFTEATSGAIAGSIFPIEGAYYVSATNGTDTAGTYISGSGSFLISGLSADTYTVTFTPLPGFVDVIVPGISVETGVVTEMGTVMIPFL